MEYVKNGIICAVKWWTKCELPSNVDNPDVKDITEKAMCVQIAGS